MASLRGRRCGWCEGRLLHAFRSVIDGYADFAGEVAAGVASPAVRAGAVAVEVASPAVALLGTRPWPMLGLSP